VRRTVDICGHSIEAAEIVESIEIGVNKRSQKQTGFGQAIGSDQLGKSSNPMSDAGGDHPMKLAAGCRGFVGLTNSRGISVPTDAV
jgi:hypothetical protein